MHRQQTEHLCETHTQATTHTASDFVLESRKTDIACIADQAHNQQANDLAMQSITQPANQPLSQPTSQATSKPITQSGQAFTQAASQPLNATNH